MRKRKGERRGEGERVFAKLVAVEIPKSVSVWNVGKFVGEGI